MNQEEQWLLKEKYAGVPDAAFQADCKRLASGEPLGYLIGHVPFLDCTIYLDSCPLIPRTETEYWTEQFITQHRLNKNHRVLDLCAGSGCIGVAVARAFPSCSITFAEIEEQHLQTIAKNLSCNVPTYSTAADQYDVRHSNLFTDVEDTFDHILSNPPYIDPNLDRTTASVKNHEPAIALYGGQQGLQHIAHIIENAPTYLNPGGTLWFEHEPEQTVAIAKLLTISDFAQYITHNDQYQIPRFTICTMAI